jgi:regulator of sigma E protease
MFLTVILFILVLSLLVFFHELGHFITAKKLGMKVDEFGFGFPPRFFGLVREKVEEKQLVNETEEVTIISSPLTSLSKGEGKIITDVIQDVVEVKAKTKWKFIWGSKEQHPEQTIYSINWIPLGGFVKIHGEAGDLKNDPRSFSNRPVWQRFIVLVAGVFMNFVFAAALLSVGFAIGLPSSVDDSISPSAKLSNEKIQIMTIAPGSAAESVGLQVGDEVLSLDDKIFTTAESARDYIKGRGEESIKFLLQRGEEKISITATAQALPSTNEVMVGVGLIKTALISFPWYLAVVKGFEATIVFSWEVILAFGNLLWNLIVHHSVSVDLAGPVGIAVMTGQAAAMGIIYLIQFAAILSINLAVINILPFPALDGGRLLFLIVEKIRGRAANEKFETTVHNLGFVLLLLLVAMVTFNDVARFGGQIIGVIKNLIGV